jgi:hypothetical protein
MEASQSTAPAVFAQDNILGSLLSVCGQKAARTAFDMQVGRFGALWLQQFFGGVAQYIRQHVSATADERLMKIYAAASIRYGAKLAVTDLLKDESVRAILRECLAPVVAADAPDTLSAPLSDAVSLYIATQRGIPKPDISKVTEQQMRNFLMWLPPQIILALSGSSSTAAAPASG